MAVYDRRRPALVRFPEAAFSDDGFADATNMKGRIFNALCAGPRWRADDGQTRTVLPRPYSFCPQRHGAALPAAARAGRAEAEGTDHASTCSTPDHDIDKGDVSTRLGTWWKA